VTSDADGSEERATTSDSTDLRRLLISGLALAPAGANVIMQLSRLPIGHAIVESNVESGSLRKHPIKRTRTTLAYIMIALFGTEHERAVMRREVNAQHHLVRSDSESVIAYDAHDPELQLWVAACMFRGVIDTVTQLRGPVEDEEFATLLSHCGRFATTLQVRASRWPSDRAAFEAYWEVAMGDVRVDDVTRTYLCGLASLEFLPAPLARLLGPSHRFLTTGFLAAPFREQLGMAWSSRQQRRFDTIVAWAARANRHLPTPVRELPWNLIERDTRRRIARGRAVL
jgi:uncharacterized protein (DUF2236 family)